MSGFTPLQIKLLLCGYTKDSRSKQVLMSHMVHGDEHDTPYFDCGVNAQFTLSNSRSVSLSLLDTGDGLPSRILEGHAYKSNVIFIVYDEFNQEQLQDEWNIVSAKIAPENVVYLIQLDASPLNEQAKNFATRNNWKHYQINLYQIDPILDLMEESVSKVLKKMGVADENAELDGSLSAAIRAKARENPFSSLSNLI